MYFKFLDEMMKELITTLGRDENIQQLQSPMGQNLGYEHGIPSGKMVIITYRSGAYCFCPVFVNFSSLYNCPIDFILIMHVLSIDNMVNDLVKFFFNLVAPRGIVFDEYILFFLYVQSVFFFDKRTLIRCVCETRMPSMATSNMTLTH